LFYNYYYLILKMMSNSNTPNKPMSKRNRVLVLEDPSSTLKPDAFGSP
jgi:hypothetical protein